MEDPTDPDPIIRARAQDAYYQRIKTVTALVKDVSLACFVPPDLLLLDALYQGGRTLQEHEFQRLEGIAAASQRLMGWADVSPTEEERAVAAYDPNEEPPRILPLQIAVGGAGDPPDTFGGSDF